MNVYFAGALTALDALREAGATHVLVSFAEVRSNPRLLERLAGLRVFLDSGAWSVASGAIAPIPVEEHIAWLRDARFPFELVAALDVIGDGDTSLRNYERERAAGLDVVPTWHAEEPLPLAAHYAATAEYVAIGGLASRARSGDVGRFIAPAWQHVAHRRTHLFGVGGGSVIAKYRPTSIDCSTWLIGSQFGAVFTLTRFPALAQIVIRRNASSFTAARSLSLVEEMRRFGSSWRELSQADSAARNRYNARLFLEYMDRIERIGRIDDGQAANE